MLIQFDPEKSRRNEINRNLPFTRVIDFDWDQAVIIEDDRYDYPEERFVVIGFLDDKLHVLCFTPAEDGIRVISFRKADKREVKRYENSINRPIR